MLRLEVYPEPRESDYEVEVLPNGKHQLIQHVRMLGRVFWNERYLGEVIENSAIPVRVS